MTINRNIVIGSYANGTLLATDIADTLNYAGALILGRLAGVAGTNAITAGIDQDVGFSNLTSGAIAVLIPANNNTGAVTLSVEGTAAVAVQRADGNPLEAGDLVAGSAYPIQYHGAVWRLLVDVRNTVVSAGGAPPYSQVDRLIASGTWTAPWRLYARIWCIGAGGGVDAGTGTNNRGGSGAGGLAMVDRFFMESGQQLTATVGAGGAGSTGAVGGASTVTGPGGLSMTANGGGGVTGGSGGVGGTASGGTINLQGQNGSQATSVQSCRGGIIRPFPDIPQTVPANIQAPVDALEMSLAFYYPDLAYTGLGPFSNLRYALATRPPIPGCGIGKADNNPTDRDGGSGILIVEYTTAIA